jgi:hypothetical protein
VLAQESAPDDAKVGALLDEVEARLARRPADAAQAAAYLELGKLAWGYGAITRAERVLAAAGPGAPAALLAEVLDTRRLLGLPKDGARVGVPVADEPAYFRAFYLAYRKFMDTEPRFAREVVDAQLARFPQAPGLLALACGVDAYAGKVPAARKKCARAIAGWDESVLAHFYAAQVAAKPAEAIAHYERVIALDPEQKSAWATLGGLYEDTGAADKHTRLAADYKARFGASLPRP